MLTRKRLFRTLIALFVMCYYHPGANAQCNFASPYGSFTMPNNTTATVSCQYGGEYSTGSGGVAGQTYVVNSSVSTDWVTVRSGTSGGAVVAFGQVPVTFVAPTSTTYYFHYSTNSTCGTQNSCRNTTVTHGATYNPCTTILTLASCGTSTATAYPSGSGAWALGPYVPPGKEILYSYTPTVTGTYSITQTGNTTGTWIDWFYKAASGGCNSSGWTFLLDILTTGTTAGFTLTAGTQYYFMMDEESTNAGTVTWTLNCPCVAPTVPTINATATTICNPGSTTLSIATGSLNSATTWTWYSGSCGGTAAGTGTSITVSPTTTTTYYVRGTGGCVTPGTCASVTINVNQPVNIATHPATTQTICAGDPLTMSVTATNNAGYQWYKNSNPITGANSSTYTIGTTTSADAGTYYCLVMGNTPCANVPSTNCVVTINDPVAIVTPPPATATVCDGSPLSIGISASNATSYQWYLNSNPISGANSATYSVPSATSADAGTYYVVLGASTGCSPATSSNTLVTVDPRPTAVMTVNGPSTVCDGTSTNIDVTFTGTAPWTFDYSDGTATTTVTTSSNPYSFSVTPSVTTNYNVTALQDANCVANGPDFAGTATVMVNPRPTATITVNGASTVCDGVSTNIDVTFTGTAPWTFDHFDGTSTTTVTTSSNPYSFTVTPNTTTTYSITSLMDANCVATSIDIAGTGTVMVNPRPTATLSNNGPATICDGSSTGIDINFTGTGPWDFTYFDGVSSNTVNAYGSSTFSFTVMPNTTTTYNVTALNDMNCTASGLDISSTATVTVNYAPTIVTPPTTLTACSGVGVTIVAAANGTGLNYQWMLNGNPLSDNTLYSGTGTDMLTINDITGLSGGSYELVISGVCPPMVTTNPVTVIEDFNNDWHGATSPAWSDPTNWSCGTVPIVTTNVLIPGTAANMPLVDIPTAICNSITIDPSATVMFTGSNNALEIKAATVNNGTFDASLGRVILSGSGSQNIPGITYKDLVIDGGSAKTLDGPATVSSLLFLTSGHIVLNGYNLTIDVPVQTLGGSAGSFIVTNGTGQVIGRNMGVGGNPDAATFHVGTNVSSYTPIMLENLGTSDDFTVSVMPNVYEDGYGVNPLLVTNPVVDRTWMVDEAVAGGSYVNMTPYWNLVNEINGFTQAHVYVVHYMGGAWVGLTDSASGSPAAGTFGLLYYAYADSISNFSPFAVASSGQFPLAIKLKNISAANAGKRNRVNWSSATEAAGDIYHLERSVDGKTFVHIGSVDAKGTPSNYTYWDETPAMGKNYYRLRMVDANSKTSYSNVVSATVSGGDVSFSINAYPNPVENMLSLVVNGTVTGKATVVLTDMTGKVVKAAQEMTGSSMEIDMSDVAQGIYFIKYSDDARSELIKVNKQ